jgi:hypothetical protein
MGPGRDVVASEWDLLRVKSEPYVRPLNGCGGKCRSSYVSVSSTNPSSSPSSSSNVSNVDANARASRMAEEKWEGVCTEKDELRACGVWVGMDWDMGMGMGRVLRPVLVRCWVDQGDEVGMCCCCCCWDE